MGLGPILADWFLIDPEPPLDVIVNPETGYAEPTGIDEALLAQRAQFLRPDSLVAIIVLSDENDCSVQDYGFGWFVANPAEGTMPRSTSMCDTDPNDPCCLSCIQPTWPDGCGNPRLDPKCRIAQVHQASEDRLELRCFRQKQRFGLDFLYPVERYVNGLRNHEVPRRDGSMAPNPLYSRSDHPLATEYADLRPRIDSSLVFLAGIVGVPWQDISTGESLTGSALEYLTSSEISQQGLWDVILGQPEANPPVPPLDPFMLEQVEPRPVGAVNPRVPSIAVEAPREQSGGNPINGHEYTILDQSDLQYACIFPMTTPKDCANVGQEWRCDCAEDSEVLQRPVCNGTVQTYAGARPGTRFLQLLRDYGENAIVGSICPKNSTGDPADRSFGFNPALDSIIERIRMAAGGSCLWRQLAVDDDGRVVCRLFEVTPPDDSARCGPAVPGRQPAEPPYVEAVRNRMRDLGICDYVENPCQAYSVCELLQAEGEAHESCLRDSDEDVTGYGYCYIDAETDRNDDGEVQCDQECYASGDATCDCRGNPDLVAHCPPLGRRRLRLAAPPDADPPLPRPDALVFASCQPGEFW